MAKDINPLKDYSEQRSKEFNDGVAKYGVEYLIKLNEEVNAVYEQKGVKTVDYKKIREEQTNEDNDEK